MKKKITIHDWGMMIGQEVESVYGSTFKIVGLGAGIDGEFTLFGEDGFFEIAEDCKPILRTLNQMTSDEMNESLDFFKVKKFDISSFEDGFNDFAFVTEFIDELQWGADKDIDVYDYLTHKGFDIRNWIDSGLAIKKEGIK